MVPGYYRWGAVIAQLQWKLFTNADSFSEEHGLARLASTKSSRVPPARAPTSATGEELAGGEPSQRVPQEIAGTPPNRSPARAPDVKGAAFDVASANGRGNAGHRVSLGAVEFAGEESAAVLVHPLEELERLLVQHGAVQALKQAEQFAVGGILRIEDLAATLEWLLEHRCEVQACGPHYQQAVRALLERLLNLVESLTVGEQTPPDAEAADEQRDEPRSSSEHLAVALCKAAALGVDAGEGSGWVTAACRGLLRNLGALSAATLVNVASAIYTLCGGSQGCTTIQTLAAEALGRLAILKSHERGELLQALDSAAPRSGARRGTEGYDESTPFVFAVLCSLAGDIARDGARLSDRSLVGLAWVSAAFGFRGTEANACEGDRIP